MAKTVCKILGVVFLLVGVAGFAAPNLLNAHLTPPHNVVHIVSGVVALYFGFAGSLSGAKGFCLVFGLLYLALGLIGMVQGDAADGRMWQCGSLDAGNGGPRHSPVVRCCLPWLAVCSQRKLNHALCVVTTFRLQGRVR